MRPLPSRGLLPKGWIWLTLLLGLVLAASGLRAQPLADPRVDWFSADSAHFRVHFRAGQRAQAEAVARAAEAVYPRVTEALQWTPRTRTEIVLYSEFDVANGFATPLPYSFMGVFLAPPDEGQLLTNSAWFDMLLVHEFTHIVHLDKLRGAPRLLQRIFGNVPWFIPNLFQPGWAIEGVAVFAESEPALGRGRLRGPWFEAFLRAEQSRGWISLREINADGRRLPVGKQYLYGAYFMEFLDRRYGDKAIGALVEQYSGNIVPRLHSAPWAATGKMMDELWEEFLADLGQQLDARSQALRAQPEQLGEAMGPVLFQVDSLAALPGDGGWLLVAGDGLRGTHLWRITPQGRQERLTRVNAGTRLSVAADGSVLLAQPDICDKLNYTYDLYRLQDARLRRLTHCAHLRRAVQAGGQLFALQLLAGETRLVRVDAGTGAVSSLLAPGQPPADAPGTPGAPGDGDELLDLTASPDGRQLFVVARRAGDWRVLALDPSATTTQPQVVVRLASPISSLRHGAAGLEMVLVEGGVPNVWRLEGNELLRLTHSHTAVQLHAGSAADGSLASAVLVPGGSQLMRLPQPAVLQRMSAMAPVVAEATATTPAQGIAAQNGASGAHTGTTPDAGLLQPERPYSALRSMFPRSWLPAVTVDRGLTAYGASTNGGDALGWHRYAALAQVETSQRELTGSVEYLFAGSHGLSLSRTLVARAWNRVDEEDEVTVFDRSTGLQWLSVFPFSRLERRVNLGLGLAMDRSERVDLPAGTRVQRHDERLLAGLLDVDLSGSDWFSDGPNRGARAGLLFESYKPLQGGDERRYDGHVLRADLRAWLGLGRGVLALRFTEARARGRTESFQLGGSTDELLQLGVSLNQRELSLRGYRGDEPSLQGPNARVATLELRWPLADIDRHAMVPPFGINRLSGVLFADVGGAWGDGESRPGRYSRGVGFELVGELKLLYALALQLRLGVAQGLDAPPGQRKTRGYLTAGRAF